MVRDSFRFLNGGVIEFGRVIIIGLKCHEFGDRVSGGGAIGL